jgi:hypothetical protein
MSEQPPRFNPLIGVPTGGQIHADTVSWLLKRGIHTAVSVGSPVDYNRNQLIRVFLDEGEAYTHLFLLDSDVVPPMDVLERLHAMDADVATGVYPLFLSGRCVIDVNFPEDIVEDHTMWPSPWPSGGVRECTRAGMGCCLVKREVFKQLEDPWFQFVMHGGGKRTGEDVYFFQQARKAGLKTMVDTAIRCSHYHAGIDLKMIADMWAERKTDGIESGIIPVMEP